MRKMELADVDAVIAEMEEAKTSTAARKAMARAALRFSNLSDEARVAWEWVAHHG